jgi:hypothetical protein
MAMIYASPSVESEIESVSSFITIEIMRPSALRESIAAIAMC